MKKIRVSTEIGSILKVNGYDDFSAIQLVKDCGFDCFDYTFYELFQYDKRNKIVSKCIDHPFNNGDYVGYAKKLRKFIDKIGIECNQTHAPFPTCSKEIQATLKKSLLFSSILGAKICVIHPQNDASEEENAEMFKLLLPYAKEVGVKIGVENMWNWIDGDSHCSDAACSHHNSFRGLLDRVNDDYLVACLDIGHAEMTGLNTSAVDMIYSLKDKLQALHIHDNDKKHDCHQILFSMDIDYIPIVMALKQINYQGELTLESVYYIQADTKDLRGDVAKLYSSVDKLRKMF